VSGDDGKSFKLDGVFDVAECNESMRQAEALYEAATQSLDAGHALADAVLDTANEVAKVGRLFPVSEVGVKASEFCTTIARTLVAHAEAFRHALPEIPQPAQGETDTDARDPEPDPAG